MCGKPLKKLNESKQIFDLYWNALNVPKVYASALTI